MNDIQAELAALLNKYSEENASGTPDFILAEFLFDCLAAFNAAVVSRADWRGETAELPSLVSLRDVTEEQE